AAPEVIAVTGPSRETPRRYTRPGPAPRVERRLRYGTGTSRISWALRRSREVRSASFTGTTIDQWWPTGQRWIRHHPSRTDLIATPGIQMVVKRGRRRQRTTVFPPTRYPRTRATIVPTTLSTTTAASTLRRVPLMAEVCR